MAVIYFYSSIVAFLVGVGTMSVLSFSYDVLVVCGVAAWVIALIATPKNYLFLISTILIGFSLGALRFDSATWQFNVLPVPENTEVTLQGEVVKAPEVRESTTHLYLDVISINGIPVTLRVLLYAPRTSMVTYGDILTVTGELAAPEVFTTDLGRTFNYPDFLRARGVALVMFRPDITVQSSGNGNKIIATLLSFKHAFLAGIQRTIPEPQAGLAAGLLLGERGGLGEALEQQFRRAGIIHIVVLSGYNVMLVVMFVMAIAGYFLRPRGRLLFGLLTISAFALMVGLSATVLRASLMAALFLVATTSSRHYAVMRALFFAGAIMVLSNPYLLLYDPGFQLSFIATFGLLAFAPYLETRLLLVPRSIGIRSFVVATIATQIWVLPFLLYQIGEVSVVSLFVNILVLPMVPVPMLLTFLTGIIAMVAPGFALLIGFVTYLALAYIILVATWFGALSFAAYSAPPFSVWVMVFLYTVFAAVWWWQKKRQADPLRGWTIEEGEEDAKGAAFKDAAPTATPVFFR